MHPTAKARGGARPSYSTQRLPWSPFWTLLLQRHLWIGRGDLRQVTDCFLQQSWKHLFRWGLFGGFFPGIVVSGFFFQSTNMDLSGREYVPQIKWCLIVRVRGGACTRLVNRSLICTVCDVMISIPRNAGNDSQKQSDNEEYYSQKVLPVFEQGEQIKSSGCVVAWK